MFAIQKMKVEQQLKGTLFKESIVQWLSYIQVPSSLSQAHTYAYVWWFDIYW